MASSDISFIEPSEDSKARNYRYSCGRELCRSAVSAFYQSRRAIAAEYQLVAATNRASHFRSRWPPRHGPKPHDEQPRAGPHSIPHNRHRSSEAQLAAYSPFPHLVLSLFGMLMLIPTRSNTTEIVIRQKTLMRRARAWIEIKK